MKLLSYVIDAHGERMEEFKIKAVLSWATPSTVKELQRFLGFANFLPAVHKVI